MIAPPVIRAALRRAATPIAFRPVAAKAPFHISARNQNAEPIGRQVPVTHFQSGSVAHEVLKVSDAAAGPVNPPGHDDEKAAMPLSKDITAQLTPTMTKFTLHGKVALVTG